MRFSRILAVSLALSLAAPALAAGPRRTLRKPAATADAPRFAVLDVAAPPGAFGCGAWGSHEVELTAVVRDLFTTELSDRAQGRLRLVGPGDGEPVAADEVAARTRGKLLGARTALTVQVTRLACKPSAAGASATAAPAPRQTKGGKGAKKRPAPAPRPSAGTRLELSGRLAVQLVDVETGTVLAALEGENAIVEPAGSGAGGGAALEYEDELASRLFAPVAEKLAGPAIEKAVRSTGR